MSEDAHDSSPISKPPTPGFPPPPRQPPAPGPVPAETDGFDEQPEEDAEEK